MDSFFLGKGPKYTAILAKRAYGYRNSGFHGLAGVDFFSM